MRYERRLLRAIKARGGSASTTGSRNLLSRLAIDLGMIGKESEIETTLLALSEKGKVRIERMAGDNSPIRSVSIVKAKTPATKPKPKQAAPTPSEALPVVRVEDKKEEEVAVGDNTPEPLHVRLSNALVALQLNAAPDGVVNANSLTTLLQGELHVSGHQAKDMLALLHRLGLKESTMVGGGRYMHRVRMDVAEVTEEMVAGLRAKKSATDIVPSVEPRAVVEAAETAQEELPEPSEGDVVTELLSIIERLEAELTASAESLDRGLEVVNRLQAEKEALEIRVTERDGEISRLREQLAAKTAPTAKAAEVIAKYRKS